MYLLTVEAIHLTKRIYMKTNTFFAPIKGHLRRVCNYRWDRVLKDPRCVGRTEKSFNFLMKVAFSGLLAGCRTLRAVENFSEILGERVPDTTLHDLLVQVDAEPLRKHLVKEVKKALRSHELPRSKFPIRLTAIDGKSISVTREELEAGWSWGVRRNNKTHYTHLMLRAFHVSNRLKLHLGQRKLSSRANEIAALPHLIDQLIADYGNTDLLEVFSVDAGMSTIKNAQYISERGYHYIMALKSPNSNFMTRGAMSLLDKQEACAVETERRNGSEVTYRLYRCPAPRLEQWQHAKEVWRVEKKTRNTTENRYYVTSLVTGKLSSSQVLQAIRMHWGIENNANWVMDTVWSEDTCPWANQALELVSYMRMLAFNIISRLKFRKLRAKKSKRKSWKDLQEFLKAFFFTHSTRQTNNSLVFV